MNKHKDDLEHPLYRLGGSAPVSVEHRGGYFNQKIILEMCKYMIYVVESGTIRVYITDEKGRKHLIKKFSEGSHIFIFSLLSIMDVLTVEIKPYKTVSAKAVEDTSILRMLVKSFVEVLEKYPELLVP